MLTICLDHCFFFIQLLKLHYVWSMFYLTFMGANVMWIGSFKLCVGFFILFKPLSYSMYGDMFHLTSIGKKNSWELGACFVTIEIATKMTKEFIKSEIEACWSLMSHIILIWLDRHQRVLTLHCWHFHDIKMFFVSTILNNWIIIIRLLIWRQFFLIIFRL
jgi:hypothetical protein